MKRMHHCGRWMKKCLKLLFLLIFLLSIGILKNFSEKNKNLRTIWDDCKINIPEGKDIITDEIVWQVLQAGRKSLKFFNAYLDTRQAQAFVRVNTNGPKIYIKTPSLYCQLWYENQNDKSSYAKVVKAHEVQSMVPGIITIFYYINNFCKILFKNISTITSKDTILLT